MPRAEYTGHGENTDGLQMHSIGDDYPFAVVGTMSLLLERVAPSETTRYYVQNLATGQKYCRWNSGTYTTSAEAHEVARRLKLDPTGTTEVWDSAPFAYAFQGS